MKIFKFTFSQNEITSCSAIKNAQLFGNLYYQEHNGQLTYALVRAIDRTEANVVVSSLVEKLTRAALGAYPELV